MSDAQTRDRITFRIRNVDADLREAVNGIDTNKLSELARDGLRMILGIRTTKKVEVTEKPIVVESRRSAPEPVTAREHQQPQPLINGSGVGISWTPKKKH